MIGDGACEGCGDDGRFGEAGHAVKNLGSRVRGRSLVGRDMDRCFGSRDVCSCFSFEVMKDPKRKLRFGSNERYTEGVRTKRRFGLS